MNPLSQLPVLVGFAALLLVLPVLLFLSPNEKWSLVLIGVLALIGFAGWLFYAWQSQRPPPGGDHPEDEDSGFAGGTGEPLRIVR